MVTNKDRSEFDGGGVMPNTVYPMGADALTPSDKLRLQSITGQEDDPRAAVDDYFWYGNQKPLPADISERLAREERLRDRDRYRETPSPY